MSDLELVLNMLAEATTTELSKTHEPKTLEENKKIAQKGGRVAGEARENIERESGKPVITPQNAVELNQFVNVLIEEFADDESQKSES